MTNKKIITSNDIHKQNDKIKLTEAELKLKECLINSLSKAADEALNKEEVND